MNPTQLLAHFDRISAAPDAIARLRRFILDLAVRGKLVEQDPNDEPASELLNRIQAEKARLVKGGEIKKERPLPPIEEDEIPFEVPTAWCWVRLNEITSYIQRGKSPKYASSDGLPVISQKCVQWRGLDLNSANQITRIFASCVTVICFGIQLALEPLVGSSGSPRRRPDWSATVTSPLYVVY